MNKTFLTSLCLPALLACPCAITPRHVSGAPSSFLAASTRQGVHPILKRRDDSPLLTLVVDSQEKSAFLYSVTFSLAGCDDPADIESLQLSVQQPTQGGQQHWQFGDLQDGGEEVTFRGNCRLAPGKNEFLLTCQLSADANLDHFVDARCLSLETSSGAVIPVDETPDIRLRVGVAIRNHGDDGIHTYRIPALATTPAGTLLCVYDMRRRGSRDLQEDIDIGLLRSTDGGQSWEAQRVIMDQDEFQGLPQQENGCSDPGIVVDPLTGDVFVAAVWTWGRPGTHQWSKGGSGPGHSIEESSQFLLVKSRDDGKTWSQPVNLTATLKDKSWILLAPSPQQGIALADGTLIMPGQGRDEQDRTFSTLIVSRDHGDTWSVTNPASLGNNECQAVELGDGSIMLNCRTNSGAKYRTVVTTADLGQSWNAHPTNRNTLIEPTCNGSTYRFDFTEGGRSRHVLFFANPHTQTSRSRHTLQVSFDDGMSWPRSHHLLLDEGLGRGYPSISRVDDQHVGIVYEGSQADLTFQRVSLDDLVSPPAGLP